MPACAARRCILSGVALMGAALVLSSAVASAEEGAGDWQRNPEEESCTPRCRAGYECTQGECLPVCSPPCGPGTLCSSGGTCVRTEPLAPPPVRYWGTQDTRSPNACVPTCRRGFSCEEGQCVSRCNPACSIGERCSARRECVPEEDGAGELPSEAGENEPEHEEEPERSASADAKANLHIDLLGALQFGVTPTLELGKKVSGYLRVRALNTGVASYFLLGHDRHDELRWGLGAGLGMHVFSAGEGNMRGVFGGPALEYVFVETRDTHQDRARHRTHALVPQFDFGRRWAWGAFLLGVGGRLGLSIPVHGEAKPIGAGGCARPESCNFDPKLWLVAGLFLDLGWFFWI
jgi:hypothetical protein